MVSRPRLDETVVLDGRQLGERRQAARLTQERLAALAAPVSRSYLSKLERQPRAVVGRELAERLAAALGVELAHLRPPMAMPDRGDPTLTVTRSAAGRSLGERLAEVMGAAELSVEEEQLIAEHLVAHAAQVVTLVKATRSR